MKKSHFKLNDDKGALSIEALISMTFFAIAILSIMFMSLMVKAQATVQYAISQTAKEISGYYYLVDKLGLASITSGKSSRSTDDMNKLIKNAMDFSSSTGGVVNVDLKSGSADINLDNLKNVDKDKMKESLKAEADTIKGMQWKDQLVGSLCVLTKSLITKGVSNVVAPAVCRALVPKYMGGSKEAADKRLRALGINGIDSIDFSYSSLLADGRSIQIVAVYKMDVSVLSLGLVKGDIMFKQVATTAAWVKPDKNHLISVADTCTK